ncbi:hypothetical protein [Catenulispora pinisilvae]|nr:hypothetical protein [Catenulispora pinisilvae]
MALPEDQHAVGAFGPGGQYESFGVGCGGQKLGSGKIFVKP